MSQAPKRVDISEYARQNIIDLYNKVIEADQAFGLYINAIKEQLGVPLDKPYKISDDGLAFELVEEMDGAAQIQTAQD